MLRKFLYISALIIAAFSIYFAVEFYTYTQSRDRQVQERGTETTALLKGEIDTILAAITQEAQRLSTLLGQGQYSRAEVEQIIRESSLSIAEIQGVTAGYEPFAFDASTQLYCPYYDKGLQDYIFVEESYDYTLSGSTASAWYTEVRDKGPRWVEPYFAKAAQDWFIDYGVPFYYSDGPREGEVRGTITMSFKCSGFKDLVHGLSLGKTGYGMIINQQGTFLAHPISEYIGRTKLADLDHSKDAIELAQGYDDLLQGKAGSIHYYDSEADDKTFFFYDRIPTSGWGIGLLFYENDLLQDGASRNHRFIRLAVTLSLLLICLLAIYFNKDYIDKQEIWRLSYLTTLLLIANILFIGYLVHTEKKALDQSESAPITDISSLGSFIEQQHIRSDKMKVQRAREIPTGIYVKRMEFLDSYNLNLGGTIWQKYPLEITEEVELGFDLPQMSPFAEAQYIEESYRDTVPANEGEQGYLLVGWEFRVTLLLNIGYQDFPLDERQVSMQLQPKRGDDRLVFTPDLGSYTYTNPSKLSGLDPSIVISGSDILESYFNYSIETYATDFGYRDKSLYEEVPVLHFNINMRRVLLNSFVTYLIPIFVTLIMMFILMNAVGKTEERQGIIESMAAFFFVLIFSHIDLRKEIVTADLIFIEYFHFVTYAMIILTTFNLVIYSKDKSKLFDYNDNQLFKASYFPFFFMMILLVMLWKFY